ncbi:MAG: Dabb family protein [bacterium]|nr:Dabb family protein [bacterium]
MTHYIIVKLKDINTLHEYVNIVKPIYNEMVESINGLNSYDLIINKVNGKNNYDVMAKLYFDSLETLETNYKPNNLHHKLKECSEHLVEKKTIFDE